MADKREKRLEGLRRRFVSEGADAFLVTNLTNVSYLTGFTGSSGYAVVTPKKAFFITDSRYTTQSRDEVEGYEVRIQKGRLSEELGKILKELGAKKVGFESRNVAFDFHGALQNELGGMELLPVKDAVEKLRAIKDEDEIDKISEAVRRAEEGFRENISRIAPGMVENETALGLEFNIRKLGAKKVPFDIIVASGERGRPAAWVSLRQRDEGRGDADNRLRRRGPRLPVGHNEERRGRRAGQETVRDI